MGLLENIATGCLGCGAPEAAEHRPTCSLRGWPRFYKVRMSDELMRQLGADGVDWGEPDAEGFYTPTVSSRYRRP